MLVFLCLSLLTWQAATAAWVMEYDRALSTTLFETGFVAPHGLSLDPSSGELCVTDRGSVSLRVMNAHGLDTFETDSRARLSLPADATLDAEGGFVFTDIDAVGSRSIRRLDFLGEPVAFQPEKPTDEWLPEQLLLTRDGNVVTIDSHLALLCKHDLDTGALVWQRSLVDTAGEIRDLVTGRPVEGPDGRLYVPLSSMHIVGVYSPAGELQGSFGVFGTTRGRMVFPAGVGFGQEGTILVLDRMRNVILLYDENRKFVAEFGSYGPAPGQLYHPRAMAVSPRGLVFVAQGLQGRVQAFRLRNSEEFETALGEPQAIDKPNAETTVAKAAPVLQANQKEVSGNILSLITRFAPTDETTTSVLSLALNVTR